MPSKELLEKVAGFSLPADVNLRLQFLMDQNNNGALSPEDREELAALAEMNETISLLRTKALRQLQSLVYRLAESQCPYSAEQLEKMRMEKGGKTLTEFWSALGQP